MLYNSSLGPFHCKRMSVSFVRQLCLKPAVMSRNQGLDPLIPDTLTKTTEGSDCIDVECGKSKAFLDTCGFLGTVQPYSSSLCRAPYSQSLMYTLLFQI